jgi:hypothetical protein
MRRVECARPVEHSGRPELVIYIENAGDFVVPLAAIKDVHSGKVILDVDRLQQPIRDALGHARDAEDPGFAAPGEIQIE